MSRRNQFMIVAGSLLVAILALLVDNLLVLAPDEKPLFVQFLVLSVLCAVVAAAIYLFLIPWAERATGPSNRLSQSGFGTGLAALAFVIIFWTALPIVLGAGGFVLGSLGERRAARDMRRAPRDEEQADPEVDAEDAERAKDEDEVDEDAPSVGERAGQAWAARVMGGLAALACLVLFVVTIVQGG